MNLVQALLQSSSILDKGGIADSHIEARILVGHILKMSSAQLYARPEQILRQKETKSLEQLLGRRLSHEPTAYIVRHKEFYGLDFYVDSRVLIPRPETELLVEQTIELVKTWVGIPTTHKKTIVAVDVGTGCGAIAISLALNLTTIQIYAIDVSASALEVARLNAVHHKVADKITFLQGNLLKPLPEHADIIIANLPYIRSQELTGLSPEIADFEPKLALDGGQDGLAHIRQLLKQYKGKISAQGCLLMEIGQNQDKAVIPLVNRYLPETTPEFVQDLSGINRIVKIQSRASRFQVDKKRDLS